jgi:phosphate transport system permease protein
MNRKTKNKFFKILCFSASISSIVVLALLLYNVVSVGLPHLSFDFLSSFPSRFAENAGIK